MRGDVCFYIPMLNLLTVALSIKSLNLYLGEESLGKLSYVFNFLSKITLMLG